MVEVVKQELWVMINSSLAEVSVYVLNVDWKDPFDMLHKLHGWHMHLFSKANRMQLLPRRKCSVSSMSGMLDRRRVHIQCVGERCDHRDFVGVRKVI